MTEIVLRDQRPYELTEKQVNIIANTAFVPDDKRGKLDVIWAAIFKGRSIGIDDMSAINEIHVVNGKPGLSAALAAGIVRKRGHVIDGELSPTKAVAHGKRGDNGAEMTFTFTIEQAKDAGLAGKDVWKKYPASMLWARAVTQLCRSLFSDCFIGGVYTPEELGADFALDADVMEGIAVEVTEEDAREDPPASPPAESPKAADDLVAPSPPGDTTPEAEDHPPLSSASGFKVPRKVAEQAGETVIPSGKYGRQTIAQVAESLDGAEWFLSMLKANDSPTRDAVVTYAREFLPDVWDAYEQSKLATA